MQWSWKKAGTHSFSWGLLIVRFRQNKQFIVGGTFFLKKTEQNNIFIVFENENQEFSKNQLGFLDKTCNCHKFSMRGIS